MGLVSKDSVSKLRGVGKVKAEAYARMGIENIGHLLEHYPRGYEDRADIKTLAEAGELSGSKSALLLVVATEPRIHRIRRGMELLKFRAYDDSGSAEITFFNQNYLKMAFKGGSEYRFYGKVEKKGNKYFISSPDFDEVNENSELIPLMPVYSLTEGISRKQLKKDISTAIAETAASGALADILPEELRRENSLCTLSYALKNIHFPSDYVSLARAKKRLIYDEFLLFALGLSIEGQRNRKRDAIPCKDTDISEFLASLPYELTDAQKRVCDDIRRDMAKDIAMSRMVVGDVGSGKTVCAASAIYIAVKNGRQAALMAPTEILARQHYADLSALFSKLGIRCELLCGATGAAEKRRIYKQLASADADERIQVVIGTHALISEGVEFASAGVIITDEQHRFGVAQRARLSEKSGEAHMLVMSATPIPRSLALAMYGDLDISKIDQMPPGRQRVDTYVVDESYRERLENFIEKQVEDGGQVYVVCPSIEESLEDEDERYDLQLGDVDFDGNVRCQRPEMKAAIPYTEELKKRFPNMSVEVVHGKMKSAEKDRVMSEFVSGNIDLLVSTTVIEVGVNVPNASLMIVENAERFGLSQLHQLRGRVGRGKRKSYCVLVSASVGKENIAGARLKTMKDIYDGYEIAEQDLSMRGPGDFVRCANDDRIRQSGGIKFKLAELCDDTGLLKKAFEDARGLLAKSPELCDYPELRDAVSNMFSIGSNEIS